MRTLAKVLGGLMLFDGLWGTLSPRSGFDFWQTYLRDKLPRGMNKMYKDYSLLSDSSIRYLSIWTALIGLFILGMSYFVRSSESGAPGMAGERFEQSRHS